MLGGFSKQCLRVKRKQQVGTRAPAGQRARSCPISCLIVPDLVLAQVSVFTLQGDTLQGDTLQGDTLEGDTLQGGTLQGVTLAR